jgi:hypothetical protein
MPKYVALIAGTGEGCDYTLECNKTWRISEAKNIEEFRACVLENSACWIQYRPDTLIEQLIIFEANGEAQTISELPESGLMRNTKGTKNRM